MRHWIKVRLQDTELAAYSFQVVEHWRSQKMAAQNIIKAIALYYTLSNGDTSLLKKYFPLLGEVRRMSVDDDTPVPFEANGKPKTRLIEKSADEDLDDFLESMGIADDEHEQ